ncbi:MAG: hypothetical protein ABIH23_01450 [bacterium]
MRHIICFCGIGLIAFVGAMTCYGLDDTPTALIADPILDEFSGVTRAESPGEYWGLSDDKACVCRFNDQGQILQTVVLAPEEPDDWEALTSDAEGYLYVGVIGNNNYSERDYRILMFPEPGPEISEIQEYGTLHFRFDGEMNYDCDSLFMLDGELYVITKPPFASSKFPTQSPKVFRIPQSAGEQTAVAEEVGLFSNPGRPTDAAYSPENGMLAVLSYHGVSLYAVHGVSDLLNDPDHTTFGQFATCESVCFDGGDLLIGNEERMLWKHPVEWFLEREKVVPALPTVAMRKGTEFPSIGDLDEEWIDAESFTLVSDRGNPPRDVQVLITDAGLFVAFDFGNTEERWSEGASWSLGESRGADDLMIMISTDLEENLPSEGTRVFDAHFYRDESGEAWPYVHLRNEIELTSQDYAAYGFSTFTLAEFTPVGGGVAYFDEEAMRTHWQAIIDRQFLPDEIFEPGAVFRFNLTLCEGGYFGDRWFWTGDFFSWDTPYAWGIVNMEEDSWVGEYMLY